MGLDDHQPIVHAAAHFKREPLGNRHRGHTGHTTGAGVRIGLGFTQQQLHTGVHFLQARRQHADLCVQRGQAARFVGVVAHLGA